MNRTVKTLIVAAGLAVSMVGAATAETLSFNGTPFDSHGVLPENFDPRSVDGISHVDQAVWETAMNASPGGQLLAARTHGDEFASGGGVSLNAGASKVTLTYLGSEAAATNSFWVNGKSLFNNTTSKIGAQESAIWNGGQIDFGFCTDWAGKPDSSGCVNNAGEYTGPAGGSLEIGFSRIFDYNDKHTVLLFFGDGLGDSDLDDMVLALTVEPVSMPLPAGMLLLGSAAVGVGFASRRRRLKN